MDAIKNSKGAQINFGVLPSIGPSIRIYTKDVSLIYVVPSIILVVMAILRSCFLPRNTKTKQQMQAYFKPQPLVGIGQKDLESMKVYIFKNTLTRLKKEVEKEPHKPYIFEKVVVDLQKAPVLLPQYWSACVALASVKITQSQVVKGGRPLSESFLKEKKIVAYIQKHQQKYPISDEVLEQWFPAAFESK